MKIFILLILSLCLIGCDKREIIEMQGIYNIKCEGIDKTTGSNLVITVGDNIVIRYVGSSGKGLIVAKRCLIE